GQSRYREDIDYSIQNRGQWVADILDALSIDTPVIVVAHDHGGVFGASFAVQYPERVKALVLQNTLFHREYNWHPMGKIWRTPIFGELNIKLIAVPALSMPIMHQYVKWGAPDLTYDHTRAMFARFKANEHMGKSMLKLYRDSDPADFAGWDDRLYALAAEKPTLVLWGKQDKYLPMAFPEKLQTHSAELVVFEDAGHWLALTQPKAYADEIIKFLNTI
ncbi:MAG: alpha/beta hydrolase, partial [Chloroflexota bacterium]